MALSSSESEYEIEEVLRHRKRGGATEYYVTWQGFDESENQWVKESDIHATAILEKYKKSLTAKGKTASKKTLSRKGSTRSAKQGSVTSVKESTVTVQGGRMTKSYDYVERGTADVGIMNKTPLVTEKSSTVSRILVQESADLDSTMSESSEVELDTPMLTRHSSSQVSRTIITESGDIGNTKATNTSLTLDDSSSDQSRKKAQASCEVVSLMIFFSCFLFVMASIVLEKHKLY